MIPDNLNDKTITDLVLDVVCVIFGIAVLNICYRNIVRAIFDFATKIK